MEPFFEHFHFSFEMKLFPSRETKDCITKIWMKPNVSARRDEARFQIRFLRERRFSPGTSGTGTNGSSSFLPARTNREREDYPRVRNSCARANGAVQPKTFKDARKCNAAAKGNKVFGSPTLVAWKFSRDSLSADRCVPKGTGRAGGMTTAARTRMSCC